MEVINIKKRILGLDLGSKTIGIAISDEMGIIARGIETFRFKENNYDLALKRVEEVCFENEVGLIVLGLPKHMSGEEGIKAKISNDFVLMIKTKIDVDVILLDERWTTKIAQDRLIEANVSRKKRKNIIDKMAAVVILQDYLDRGK